MCMPWYSVLLGTSMDGLASRHVVMALFVITFVLG
jgi:hypothetical protein